MPLPLNNRFTNLIDESDSESDNDVPNEVSPQQQDQLSKEPITNNKKSYSNNNKKEKKKQKNKPQSPQPKKKEEKISEPIKQEQNPQQESTSSWKLSTSPIPSTSSTSEETIVIRKIDYDTLVNAINNLKSIVLDQNQKIKQLQAALTSVKEKSSQIRSLASIADEIDQIIAKNQN